jgi:hypothetical protein
MRSIYHIQADIIQEIIHVGQLAMLLHCGESVMVVCFHDAIVLQIIKLHARILYKVF